MQGHHPDHQNVVRHSCQQQRHYADECPNRTLYCQDEPQYDFDVYDQHIEVEQPCEAPQQAPPTRNVEAEEGPLLVFRLLMTNEKEDPKP